MHTPVKPIDLMAWPFDLARAQYAQSVRWGWTERSLLASARFNQMLVAMEKLMLGPWARHY